MITKLKLTHEIDYLNHQFTSSIKNRLSDLEIFSESALEWLMLEHYQFSARNPEFLSIATNTTRQFKNTGIAEELQHNFNEERNHAAIYKKALLEIGTDVNKRIEFTPTTEFFNNILKLISTCPSCTLGAMYATETAAIFEHEIFLNISFEVIKRRKKTWVRSRLKAFHDMHLNGVEQGHKDGLGMFVDLASKDTASKQFIQEGHIIKGAKQAINSMMIWWQALLNQAEMSNE
ncbi:DUF3865 domain-containing protein [Legionella sp. CNM-1927-20]|uniref:DUF3865 domain-containing protein n=1 Tax=Legionella sp. CNM-1927-20 TaxID=3422221 RepID=UPI00403AF16E